MEIQTSRHKIGFFYIDDLLPEEIATKIQLNFPKSSEMVLKKSIRENKYIAAQMNLYAILNMGLFTYYVSQKWGGPDPPSPPCQPKIRN